MDSRNFIYAPRWVKVTAMSVLAIALASAVMVGLFFIGREQHEDWILVSMSLAQVAASGLVVALVVFFSERDVNVLELQKRTERLLLDTFPRACAFIDYPQPTFVDWDDARRPRAKQLKKAVERSRTRIEISHAAGQIDAYYRITWQNGVSMVIRLQVNVGEVVISYYIPASSEAEKDRIAATLSWAFSRYIEVSGYSGNWYFSREAFDDNDYASIHLTRDFGDDFLEDERKKLFVVNDISASTRGIMKDCVKHGIATSY